MTLNLKSKPQTKTHISVLVPGVRSSCSLIPHQTLVELLLCQRYNSRADIGFFFSKEGVFDSCLLFSTITRATVIWFQQWKQLVMLLRSWRCAACHQQLFISNSSTAPQSLGPAQTVKTFKIIQLWGRWNVKRKNTLLAPLSLSLSSQSPESLIFWTFCLLF